jgi:hypothetical protein
MPPTPLDVSQRATTPLPERKPKRRPRHKPAPRCQRESCNRGVRLHYKHCCYLCEVIDDHQNRTQRMCEAVGTRPESTAVWVASAELNDALTHFFALEKELFLLATEQLGFTEDQWREVKRGE